MDYKQALEFLRARLFEAPPTEAPKKSSYIPPMQNQPSDTRDSSDILSVSQDWLMTIKQSSQATQDRFKKPASGGFASGFAATAFTPKKEKSEKKAEAGEKSEGIIKRKVDPKEGGVELSAASETVSPGYGEIKQSDIEAIIRTEAEARGINPTTAIAIFRSEGAGNYQSQIPRSGKGSVGGKEASYGPYQLYTGGGLGNQYEKLTGRDLTTDNTIEGITNQIRFSLDMAVDQGWSPWYGRKHAGVGVRDGLSGAKKVGNWK